MCSKLNCNWKFAWLSWIGTVTFSSVYCQTVWSTAISVVSVVPEVSSQIRNSQNESMFWRWRLKRPWAICWLAIFVAKIRWLDSPRAFWSYTSGPIVVSRVRYCNNNVWDFTERTVKLHSTRGCAIYRFAGVAIRTYVYYSTSLIRLRS